MRQIKRVGKGILKVHCVHLVVLIYHTHTACSWSITTDPADTLFQHSSQSIRGQ
jgi:hypothetical protein